MPIVGWKHDVLNNHDCWSADMPGVRLRGWDFRELWIDGKRAIRARYPAVGYLTVVVPPDHKTPWNQAQDSFGFKGGDVPMDLPAGEAEAVIMNRWVESRLPIGKVDAAAHQAACLRKTPFQLEDDDPYWLEGSPRWLTEPGDWYLDRIKGRLYYLPRPGETIEKLQVVAPRLSSLLKLSDCTGVTIHGINFAHSEWNFPDPLPGAPLEAGGFSQADLGVPCAVSLVGCRDCKLESCTFEHVGDYALETAKACQRCVIDHCTFTDLGAGAIKIGDGEQYPTKAEQAFENIVTDCKITDGGHLFPSSIGIWVGQTYDNRIEHNDISDLYYTGISTGWTWGYGPSLAYGNHFEHNLIHHIGKKTNGDGPILSDMGAIYALGVRKGTVITSNLFHDIEARVYGGWGIYLDEGSSDVRIENNLVYRTTHGGSHLNYGKNNRVLNNIFALGRDVQIARTRSEPDQNLIFKHNLVYWDSGDLTSADSTGVSFDENLYECTGQGKQIFGGKSWPQWQTAGQDLHSNFTRDCFVNPTLGDFKLRPGTPYTQIKFAPFDVSNVGVRLKK